jgi:FK506-binding nuclear protein
MASIDPDAETEAAPRATLRIIHDVLDIFEQDSEEDSDEEDNIAALEKRLGITAGDSDDEMSVDDDEDSEEEGVNGGPSDPEARLKLAQEINGEEESSDDDDDEAVPNGINGINGVLNKGKARAFNEDDDLQGMQEYIVCTLDRNLVSFDIHSPRNHSNPSY